MIDPQNVPRDMPLWQRQEFALFSISVAGHRADATARSVHDALLKMEYPYVYGMPFQAVRSYRFRIPSLELILRKSGIGCYRSRARSWLEIAHSQINLYLCTTDDLENIYGVGPKTSRFFIMYSRPSEANNYAILDRHILRWLGENVEGVTPPAHTPASRKRYRELELAFLQAARERGLTAKELDEIVWKEATS